MVQERDSYKASFTSPQKQERAPLANISVKMQSPPPKQPQSEDDDIDAIVNQASQPEFGKPSPMRNPHKRPEPNPFIPRKPSFKPLPPRNTQQAPQPTEDLFSSHNPMYSTYPSQDRTGSSQPRTFYKPQTHVPGQGRSVVEAAQRQMQQPYKRSFPTSSTEIQRPTNASLPTIQAAPKPTFSSLGPKTFYQPFQAPPPPKPVVDLTKDNDDDDDDQFDPDAALRERDDSFGAADPYMYVDSAQANENIKNLLEGAFDDEEDKSKTRLRRRAKKALDEGKEKEVKSLASKLAAMDVKKDDAEPTQAKQKDEVEEEEEDDGTVEGLNIKLLPHQVDGVAWMIDKEIGKRKRNGVLPHGGILADDMGLGKTVQSISLIMTNPRPELDAKPEHKGQKMPGKDVGKSTLVVAPLALIRQWEDEIKTKVLKSHALRVLVHHGPSRTKSAAELKKYDVVITTYQTLTSEHQGSNLDKEGGPRVGCFGVKWYRIMLDEAHSIKNRSAKATQAACALESWYRWCLTGTPMQNNLDELQSLIKFLRIKPYCELSNWKQQITGPMKNGRGGLAMKRLNFFLKAFMKRRTKDILKKDGALNFGGSAKEGEAKEGKQSMQIVKREVLTVECDFDGAEAQFYERLASRADERLKQITKDGAKADYIGALVLLLRLRQACNHPQLIEMAMNKDKDALTTGMGSGMQTPRKQSSAEGDIDDLAALMGGVSIQSKNCDVCQIQLSQAQAKTGAVRCAECEADLSEMRASEAKGREVKKDKTRDRRRRNRKVVDDSDDEDVNGEGEGEWIAEGSDGRRIDLSRAGGSDDEDAEGGGESLASIDSERSEDEEEDVEDSPSRARPLHRHKKAQSDDENTESGGEEENETDSDRSDSEELVPIIRGMGSSGKSDSAPSTKIRKLLRILHAESPQHKTIVFSQFTTMLDLIEPHLVSSNLRFVRYDGSMRPDQREASLHSLKNDKKTRILLCSLKCGSLGLNLTAASRVVIIEPFWNPFVEEQAIDRVHRLNQTVDVKVFRLIIRNSVETRILDLQQRKRELAAAAIEGGKAVGKLSMQDIMSLFRHDAEHSMQHDKDDREMWARFGSDSRLLDGGSAGDPVGPVSNHDARARGLKPGKEKLFKEHDVFGRRW